MPLLVAPAGCLAEEMEPRPVELVAEVTFLLGAGPTGAGTIVIGDARGAGGVAGGGVAGGGIVGEEGRKAELGDLRANVIQKLKISYQPKIKVGVFSHSLTLRLGYYICTFWGYKCLFLGVLKLFSLYVRMRSFILKRVKWGIDF